jgi:hypothetical protein
MFTQRVHAYSFMPLFTQSNLREQTHLKANKTGAFHVFTSRTNCAHARVQFIPPLGG